MGRELQLEALAHLKTNHSALSPQCARGFYHVCGRAGRLLAVAGRDLQGTTCKQKRNIGNAPWFSEDEFEGCAAAELEEEAVSEERAEEAADGAR